MKSDRNKAGNGVSTSATGEPEPRAARTYVPIWLIVVVGVLMYWAQLYFEDHAGAFHPQVYEAYASIDHVRAQAPQSEEEMFLARGRAVYMANCQVCHQGHGQGLPGQFPPLAGSEWVVADGTARLIRIPMHGLTGPIQVRGQTWVGTMTPIPLNDEDLAAVLSYIRNAWGNEAAPVTPEQVSQVRQETANRPTDGTRPWTADELLQVPEGL
jgi:mono/diheme cytochrome c family protein